MKYSGRFRKVPRRNNIYNIVKYKTRYIYNTARNARTQDKRTEIKGSSQDVWICICIRTTAQILMESLKYSGKEKGTLWLWKEYRYTRISWEINVISEILLMEKICTYSVGYEFWVFFFFVTLGNMNLWYAHASVTDCSSRLKS